MMTENQNPPLECRIGKFKVPGGIRYSVQIEHRTEKSGTVRGSFLEIVNFLVVRKKYWKYESVSFNSMSNPKSVPVMYPLDQEELEEVESLYVRRTKQNLLGPSTDVPA